MQCLLSYAITNLTFQSIIATKRLVNKWNKKTLLEVNAEEMLEVNKRCESSDLIERCLAFFSQKNKL